METGKHHLSALLMSLSSTLVSLRKELISSSGTPIFVSASQVTLLDCLALVASGVSASRSNQTITNGERVLKASTPKATE